MVLEEVAEAAPAGMPTDSTRAFRLLMIGSSFSMLGSRVTDIAYPMLVLYLTRSPLITGWVACAVVAPSILAYVPAGVLVDRLDPRRVMLAGEFGRGVLVAAVVATLALGRPNVPLLIASAAAGSVLETFSTLAERCYVRLLVEPTQVPSAQARMETRTHAMLLAGRPLGGFLFGLGPIVPFLFDALSFVISVGAVMRIETISLTFRAFGEKYRSMASVMRRSLTAEMQLGDRTGDALRWLRGNPFVAHTLLISASGTLYCQALIMILLASAHSRGLSPIATGVLLAASGAGGAVGSSAIARPLKNWRFPWVRFQALSWPVAFALFAFWGWGSFLLAAALLAFLGGTGALGNIELNTCLAQQVDEGMLARVTGIVRVLTFAGCAAGWALGGLLAEHDEQHAVWVLFVTALALPVLSVLRPPAGADTAGYGMTTARQSPPHAGHQSRRDPRPGPESLPMPSVGRNGSTLILADPQHGAASRLSSPVEPYPVTFLVEPERLGIEGDRGVDVIDSDLDLAEPAAGLERWHHDSLLKEAVGAADLGGQQVSLTFQAAPVTGQDVVSDRSGLVIDDQADLLNGQAVPAQHRDLPGAPGLIAPVPSVAGHRIDGGWEEQANLVVMPQGADGQSRQPGEPADGHRLVVLHDTTIDPRVTGESTRSLPCHRRPGSFWRGTDSGYQGNVRDALIWRP